MEVYNRVQSGELAGSATAVQMPDIDCRAVIFCGAKSNDNKVYIGGAGVTVPDGTTDTTSGLELEAGDMTPPLPVSNLKLFYYICASATDDLLYLALG